jgi:molybdenum cofactor cytidylyltransferase
MEIKMIGILLAAGFSRRFGTDDKLLYPLPNGTAIAISAAQRLIAALPLSVAVVRPENTYLAERLRALGLHVAFCPENAHHMADSLICAVRYATQFAQQHDGFVIALGDMPYIKPATIVAVANAVTAGAAIAIPTFNGQRGHPVGFAATFRLELEQLSGDEGARAIVKRHAHQVVLVACEDGGILADIDTPSDVVT